MRAKVNAGPQAAVWIAAVRNFFWTKLEADSPFAPTKNPENTIEKPPKCTPKLDLDLSKNVPNTLCQLWGEGRLIRGESSLKIRTAYENYLAKTKSSAHV